MSRHYTLLPIALILSLAACVAEPEAPQPDPRTRVDTPSGPVVGFERDTVFQWRGLPYAQPPLGELRWRAPRPVQPWTTERDASKHGNHCLQIGNPLGSTPPEDFGLPSGSEDCLYLDVYAPQASASGDSSEPLPVMFWIHGGGNLYGRGSAYDFTALARKGQVVVVSINYRLGGFGWFAHPALRKSAKTQADRSSNQAVLDMIAALKWTKTHITAFGGNPDNITIFGESAGGVNVFSLLASPLAKNLFHRAIVQSGTPRSVSLEWAEQDSPHSALNMQTHWLRGISAPGTPAATLAWLQRLDANTLLYSYEETATGITPNPPRTIADGIALPKGGIRAALAKGKYNKVPVISGSNRDETKLFMALNPELVDSWFGNLQIFIRDKTLYERSSYYGSGIWKAAAVDGIAPLLKSRRFWAYRFDWDEASSILFTDFSEVFGAAHAFEIPFVTGSMRLSQLTPILFNDENLPAATHLSDQMIGYWSTFAYRGDPGDGGGKGPVWKPWGSEQNQLVLDTESGGGVRNESGKVLSTQLLLQQLASDAQITNPEARCRIAYGVLDWALPLRTSRSDNWENYLSWNGGMCKEYAQNLRY